MKRRRFIFCLLGATALGWRAWETRSNHWYGANSKPPRDLLRVVRSNQALGTRVTLTVYHQDQDVAEQAIADAFAAIEEVEEVMSLYRPDSQLSQLNSHGRLDGPHPWLRRVLEAAQDLSQRSAGAFDVTVQPLWDAYQKAFLEHRLPSRIEISNALQRIGWRQIDLQPNAIELRQPGAALTLNGIAQGFAADAATQALRQRGIEHALVDSGEIGTVGSHVRKDGWEIGIKHPRQAHALLGLAALEGRCLATSGDYETRFSEDFIHHHLIDPRTGASPTELSSVSVVAPSAMEADALSTAVFLMGLQSGKDLIESMPNVDALFVDKFNRVTRTSNFPLQT